jgi:hypothetical protein
MDDRRTRRESLHERLAQVERLLEQQQSEIHQQREEIVRLRTAVSNTSGALPRRPFPAPPDASQPVRESVMSASPDGVADLTQGKRARSRRALLKLGGAAAAAGVAAAATAATEIAHPGTAWANGVTWQTGGFVADNQTLVTTTNGYMDSTLLTATLGHGTVYLPLGGSAAIAAYDATGTNACAVYATSTSGNGVTALANGGSGVEAHSLNGNGVLGISFGNGMAAVAGSCPPGYGGAFSGGSAPLLLNLNTGPGAPVGPNRLAGEVYLDSDAVMWLCTASGSPGTWVRLTGVRSGVPGGALNYLPAPIRIFDSRASQPAPLPVSKAPLAGGSTTTIQVTGTTVGGLSVPAGATGVFGNLTVTNTQGAGDLILWPHGAPQPNASNINYGPGQTVANSVNVGLSASGAMDLFVHVSGTNVIFDVAGYVL